MLIAAFVTTLASAAMIAALSLLSLFSGRFQFWPPPDRNSWQYQSFWFLFMVFVCAVDALCVVDLGTVYEDAPLLFALGVLWALSGFGAAFYTTYFLGVKDALGERDQLQVDGVYKWSRNPIYVFTIIGMIGLGLLVGSSYVDVALLLWAGMYVVAPFLEEPWLERQYGEAYAAYRRWTPRFVGFPKRA